MLLTRLFISIPDTPGTRVSSQLTMNCRISCQVEVYVQATSPPLNQSKKPTLNSSQAAAPLPLAYVGYDLSIVGSSNCLRQLGTCIYVTNLPMEVSGRDVAGLEPAIAVVKSMALPLIGRAPVPDR